MPTPSLLIAALIATAAPAGTADARSFDPPFMLTSASGPAILSHAPGQAAGQAAPILAASESRITAAHLQALETNDPSGLVTLASEIRALDVAGSPDLDRYRRYWSGYANYLAAMEFMRLRRMDEARTAVTTAVGDLEAIPDRDADANALYGLVGGFNLAFVPRQEMMDHVSKVSASLSGALAAEPDNVRALYANALSDMGTPKEYGGGARAEGLLRQAVAAAPTRDRPLRPDWGHDMAAAFLIQLLLTDGKTDEAATLNANLQRDYPGSVGARMVAARFPAAN